MYTIQPKKSDKITLEIDIRQHTMPMGLRKLPSIKIERDKRPDRSRVRRKKWDV